MLTIVHGDCPGHNAGIETSLCHYLTFQRAHWGETQERRAISPPLPCCCCTRGTSLKYWLYRFPDSGYKWVYLKIKRYNIIFMSYLVSFLKNGGSNLQFRCKLFFYWSVNFWPSIILLQQTLPTGCKFFKTKKYQIHILQLFKVIEN